MAHRCSANIEDDAFKSYFDEFCHIGQRMDLIFFQKRNYEETIILYKNCRIDYQMQIKYENALKELENLTCKIFTYFKNFL